MPVRRFAFVSILLFALFVPGCSITETAVVSLAEGLRLELTNQKFGKIYDDASDYLHSNVSREVFIERARLLVEAAQRVERDVRWVEDDSLGESFKELQLEKSSTLYAYRKVGSGERMVRILICWEVRDGKAKLFDISAFSSTDNYETVGKIVKSE
ncbi:MAG: hypothetical protein ABI999_18200 [Acidobacteriota bacterium]